jgi:CheY-like chemotaxis protein
MPDSGKALRRDALTSGVVRRPAHVLVVDDDPDARKILRAFLEAEGYVTSEAIDGLDALDQLSTLVQAEPLPIVVTDLRMPRMDGWSLCAALGMDARFSHVPVVVCSASPQGAPPAAAVLSKPIDPARLISTLARCRGRMPGRASAATAED